MEVVILLDRDGTIIEDRHYIRKVEDVVLLPRAIEALKTLKQKGYRLVLVSNQSGLGRGLITQTEFSEVHDRFVEILNQHQVTLNDFAYCFHAPESQCDCRKPQTGGVERVLKGVEVDWKRSFAVGDSLCDVQLGEALSAEGVLVLTGKGPMTQQQLKSRTTPVFTDLAEFSAWAPAL